LDNPIESVARERCAKLFTSKAALELTTEQAEALIIVAFCYGAAWALGTEEVIELGNAQMESLRSAKQ